jgi:hypothetical protein
MRMFRVLLVLGTILFISTFSTFSWVVPTPDDWLGFTFGSRTNERIETDPTGVPEPVSLLLLPCVLGSSASDI